MGMLSRMSMIFKSKVNKVLDRHEDPNETLDYSYEKLMEMLRDVKRGVVEMVTAKRRLELQSAKVQESITKLDLQARKSLEVGREDLARLALERKQAAIAELQGLEQQVSGLEIEQEKLTQAEQRLQAKIAAFRTKKEIIKAQYSAVQAQVRIGSAMSGVGEEISDVAMAIERAENKTETLRAKAGAIDELVASGVLDSPLEGGKDDIDRQLAQMTTRASVDAELEQIKASLGPGKSSSTAGLKPGTTGVEPKKLPEGQ
ncbi:MAG: PspA/IM30 family protein [SAR202 cluster bacterium]|nr:PspA/IM30 family protein [SAR202 cluster bacterium]